MNAVRGIGAAGLLALVVLPCRLEDGKTQKVETFSAGEVGFDVLQDRVAGRVRRCGRGSAFV
jgi:hypothetical protein